MKQEDPPTFLDLTGYPPDMEPEDMLKEAGRRWREMSSEEKWAKWKEVGVVPPALSSVQNDPDNPPNTEFAEMMKEALRRYQGMSPEEKQAYWQKAAPHPPYSFPDQENRSPFTGIPLSEFDRLGIPRPNYDLALRNMAIIAEERKKLRESGLSPEEVKERLRPLAAELLDPQSRLNQAIREYQALLSEGISPEEAKERLREKFPELGERREME